MALDSKLEVLRMRAARALGEHRVADAVAKVKAIIGPANIPDSEPLAQAALDKLHEGEIPTPQELTALEIVVRLLRPVVLSRKGQLDDLPESPGHNLHPQELKDLWSDFRGKITPLLYSIGRVELAAGTHVGTGFLIADGLIATNRHVLGVLTLGSEVLAPGASRIVFKQEAGSTNPPEHIVPLEGVAAIHPKLDMVLLSLKKLGRPILEVETDLAAEGDRVTVVGYPANDPVNNPLFLSGVFQNKFGSKCAAMGEVLEGTESPTLLHDASTTQGNSGSPIFSLATGGVVGIHRAGYFMYRNEAVDAIELGQFIESAAQAAVP
jgi:S1-C subfamily serine protease